MSNHQYMECLKCDELMDETNNKKTGWFTRFDCPKCKCSVIESDGSNYPDEDEDEYEDKSNGSCSTCGLTLCNCDE